MFQRNYMDYHSDRYSDYSLLVYNNHDEIIALLPANKSDNSLISHQGLTFGGLIKSASISTQGTIDAFKSVVKFIREEGNFETLLYKRMPDFYCALPCQEDLYALFLLEAELVGRNLSLGVNLHQEFRFKRLRERQIKKATRHGVRVVETQELEFFWKILSENLLNKFGRRPTHSLEEITYLREMFPDNIRCFVAICDDEVVAGTVIYETELVAHAQYLATNSRGNEIGALDSVINYLIKIEFQEKNYFDFGISSEQDGRVLNTGLSSYKEGFGAHALIHDFYEIKIK